MFTVCPKCALTLVVTAQDLRVAQGYVRCGRCSNVFNAIVGLTDDRGALAGNNAGGNTGGQSTASTSIIRKAPSINDDEPHDPLSETGETEAVYAEPDADEVKFQEVFSDAPPPQPTPKPFVFIAPPPGPPIKASLSEDPTKRYSDTEGIETYPEHELEFNPERTDVTKVFVEAAPVTFRTNAETGRFEKIVLQPDGSMAPPASKSANGRDPASAPTQAPKSPQPRTPAQPAVVPPPARAPTQAAATASPSGTPISPANGSSTTGASTANGNARANGRTPPAPASPVAQSPAAPRQPPLRPSPPPQAAKSPVKPAAPVSPPSSPPPTPPRPAFADEDLDEESFELDDQLRDLAERIDVTGSQPAPRFDSAANDEAIAERTENEARFAAIAKQLDERDDFGPKEFEPDDLGPRNFGAIDDAPIGDIYAKATPRPPPPRNDGRGAKRARAPSSPPDSFQADGQIETDIGAGTLTREPAPRSRFMLWVAAAAVLSIGLVAQAVHSNRNELATNAMLNRPLTRFYKALGVTIVPSWDLTAYDVRQLGASTNEGGPGTLTVRASVKNNAGQPLPLPLLRITMQDRYGNRIATRDVEPKGYVPGAVPDGANLGVGQRIDAEMTFKDPGQDAVGFEIDACLPNAAGRIACANDAALAAR